MNTVSLIGRIGKDIELKYAQSGSAIANFSIAVDQSYIKDGQKVEKTSWIDIKAFGKTAENINQYFRKGSKIGVTGELEQETWTAQDGTNRSKLVVKLNKFHFIDGKNESSSGGYKQPQQNYNQSPQGYGNQPMQQPAHTDYQPQQQQSYNQQMPQQPLPMDVDTENVPF